MSALSDFIGGAPKAWVTGTTYAVGVVVFSPTDYQYYMRKTAGAGATDPVTDTTNWQPTGARAIKSIQRGAVSYTGNTGTTVTVSAVVTAKSQLVWGGVGADSSTPLWTVPISMFLTNSTTITVSTAPCSAGTLVRGSWELIERY
jgi:hypothetical protein